MESLFFIALDYGRGGGKQEQEEEEEVGISITDTLSLSLTLFSTLDLARSPSLILSAQVRT